MTYEKMYGEVRAKEIKERLRKIHLECEKYRIGKTYEELYGSDKATTIRQKQSDKKRGRICGSQTGETRKKKSLIMKQSAKRGSEHYKSGYHYTEVEKQELSEKSSSGLKKYYATRREKHITGGHYSKAGKRSDLQQYFRSSWEANIARVFNRLNVPWVYEPERFSVYDTNGQLFGTYLPDFLVGNIYVEIKGWYRTNEEKLKLELFAKTHRLIVIDAMFYFDIEQWISKSIPNWESSTSIRQTSRTDEDVLCTA